MIENEVKIVLDLLPATAHTQEYPDFLPSFLRKHITQGYHSRGGRVRREKIETAPPRYTFNYKITLPDQQEEEFEMPIDQASFDRTYPLCDIRLTKFRYTYVDQSVESEHLVWDVDFFTDPEGRIYFAMAECEMPEGMDRPTRSQPFIDRFRLYDVAKGDRRFTSKKLADIKYAMNLLEDIKYGRLSV
jgi:hypothetical protein